MFADCSNSTTKALFSNFLILSEHGCNPTFAFKTSDYTIVEGDSVKISVSAYNSTAVTFQTSFELKVIVYNNYLIVDTFFNDSKKVMINLQSLMKTGAFECQDFQMLVKLDEVVAFNDSTDGMYFISVNLASAKAGQVFSISGTPVGYQPINVQ